jgi:phage FluMu protein gp41
MSKNNKRPIKVILELSTRDLHAVIKLAEELDKAEFEKSEDVLDLMKKVCEAFEDAARKAKA